MRHYRHLREFCDFRWLEAQLLTLGAKFIKKSHASVETVHHAVNSVTGLIVSKSQADDVRIAHRIVELTLKLPQNLGTHRSFRTASCEKGGGQRPRKLSIGVVTGPLISSQKGPLPLVASGQRA